MIPETVIPIIEKYRSHRGGLVSILEEIQGKCGYLPEDALRVVAHETGRALVDIYGVATFYKAFRLQPRGRHLASVCLGTACHVRGAPAVSEEFEKQLTVEAGGGTTADREFTLETVRCLGACALGPIVVVDGRYFANTSTAKVSGIIAKTRAGFEVSDTKNDKRVFPLEVACPHCNHSLMDASRLVDGVPSIRLTVSYMHEHGYLLLSSLYGSYTIESGNEIPFGTVVNFFCPHCHAELIGAWNCAVCDAPMVPMIVRAGGIVQICSRRGCKSHMLDLEGVNL